MTISVGGYINFQLISYHFKVTSVMSDGQIPVLFAIAMGTDALVALVIGPLFDKKGTTDAYHYPDIKHSYRTSGYLDKL